jgi:hypothetical protein
MPLVPDGPGVLHQVACILATSQLPRGIAAAMRLKYITLLARDITNDRVTKVRGIVPSDRLLRHTSAALLHDQLHAVELLIHQHNHAVGASGGTDSHPHSPAPAHALA